MLKLRVKYMVMAARRMIPVYTSTGDVGAFLVYPYLFNRSGEWIGWVTKEREVYSVQGRYVGYIGSGPRILRKRAYGFDKPARKPPPPPSPIRVPATVPLPPLMSELPFTVVDVLDEEPERLPTVDAGEFREDMD